MRDIYSAVEFTSSTVSTVRRYSASPSRAAFCRWPITLAAIFEQCILAQITDLDSRHARLQQIVQASGPASFLEGDAQISTQPVDELQTVLAVVAMMLSITTLPTEFLTKIEILSLCTSSPICLTLSSKGAPFWRGLSSALKRYSQRGALFIMCLFQCELGMLTCLTGTWRAVVVYNARSAARHMLLALGTQSGGTRADTLAGFAIRPPRAAPLA